MRVANILLIGPWGPTALTFARSLQRRGLGVYLLQASAPHPLARFPGLLGSHAIDQNRVGTNEGLAQITRYAREVNASALVASVDGEMLWLAKHRNAFEPTCQVLVQPFESLQRLHSKSYQLDLAARAGLHVLPTRLLRTLGDVDSIHAHEYPVVIRPDRPEDIDPSFKMKLVRSSEELRALMRGCRRIDSVIIAQPFRSLPNLVVHGVRSIDGRVIATGCYSVPRKFEGVTLALESVPFPDGLEALCSGFARLGGITGCYHLEFLFSPADKRAYFLEVNVRLGGTTDKVVRTGFDEPALLLEAYGLIQPGSSPHEPHVGRVVNKRVILKHIVWAAQGKLTVFDYPNVNRFTHIATSCRDLIAARDSIFDWRDVSGSIRFHLRG